MIDHPDQVERLMERLSAALPIPARVTPEVQLALKNKRGVAMPPDCTVTWISYAGTKVGSFVVLRLISRRPRRCSPLLPISASTRARLSHAKSSLTRSTG
jgi:hypothetical protein